MPYHKIADIEAWNDPLQPTNNYAMSGGKLYRRYESGMMRMVGYGVSGGAAIYPDWQMRSEWRAVPEITLP